MSHLTLPPQKNYEISKERALREILFHTPEALATKTGAYLKDDKIVFPFFKWIVIFNLQNNMLELPTDISSKSTEGLILHYLSYAKGTIPKCNWINFYQIKDAATYLPVFNKRTVNIINKIVKSQAQFIEKCLKLGGKEISFTSSAKTFKFDAFPYVPILLVYFEGDDEIPSELKFMFDISITDNLPAEDVVVVSQFLSLQFFKV